MLQRFIFVSIACLSFSAYSASNDPYANLKFYYGDNHFHSGFSGDNTGDTDPLSAFTNAIHQIQQFGKNSKAGGDGTDDLGGYFLFMSDHVQFAPTRHDMTNDMYQIMRREINEPLLELNDKQITFTVFSGGELTGMARDHVIVPPWDSKFGHMNIFNLDSIANFTTNSFSYIKGTEAMDRLTREPNAIGQFNHPGYNNEPRTGNDSNSLYPYTEARDKVYNFFEISDGQTGNWDAGIAQYNICLQKGYHVSPVIGSDIHNTREALLFQNPAPFKTARTVIIAPATVNLSHQERRNVLLDSVRHGLVYATENSNLHIKFSINDFLIGHRFADVPAKLSVRIDVEDLRDNPLQTIELVQNKKCDVPDGDVVSEQQCTTRIKLWDANSDPEFQKNKTQFHVVYNIDSKNLNSLKYIYLKVTQANHDRAMTTPFFF